MLNWSPALFVSSQLIEPPVQATAPPATGAHTSAGFPQTELLAEFAKLQQRVEQRLDAQSVSQGLDSFRHSIDMLRETQAQHRQNALRAQQETLQAIHAVSERQSREQQETLQAIHAVSERQSREQQETLKAIPCSQ